MDTDGGPSSARFADARLFCDVVMKGGITSGVVYPKAICALAEKYRFRNIGGTSAGAIAAAATAAAEYGRGREGGGFEEVEELRRRLAEEGKLIGLFQPQKGTHRLHHALIAGLARGKVARLGALVVYAMPATIGAAPGLLIAAMLVVTASLSGSLGLLLGAIALAVAAISFAAIGAALGVAVAVARDLNTRVVENAFGICSGMPTDPDDSGDPTALTPWLHERIERCAGHRDRPADRPLTFGDLWCAPGETWDETKTEDDRQINLAMMTTNLVNRRGHTMPWDERDWYFSPAEFSKLFPAEVVQHMLENPRPVGGTPGKKSWADSLVGRGIAWRQGLRPLPEAKDMPVIVATRMSLSFPVLLSAVPLWQFDYSWKENAERLKAWKKWGERLLEDGHTGVLEHPASWSSDGDPPPECPVFERCWFSDGGITSNFPVHFFDRLVPRWPTFGIDLRPFPYGRKPSDDQSQNVEVPRSNNEGIEDWWYRFPKPSAGFFGLADGRLRAFVGSAVKTMQNRVDEAQMRVPGFRDRIAHVNLASTEGGMNLNMDKAEIEVLVERGEDAAQRLISAYRPGNADPGVSWDNHRWVRFRSSIAVLERMNRLFAEGFGKPPLFPAEERTYDQLVDAPPSYRLKPWERDLAKKEIAAICSMPKAREGSRDSMADGQPRPAPVGRITPKE
ncbi:MAG TPA: patatin-like phospholipase family protein [Solirubrobacterales bacterium]|nr:patatin-like phospholipase family protein [Solirubrobacterales bacterium]